MAGAEGSEHYKRNARIVIIHMLAYFRDAHMHAAIYVRSGFILQLFGLDRSTPRCAVPALLLCVLWWTPRVHGRQQAATRPKRRTLRIPDPKDGSTGKGILGKGRGKVAKSKGAAAIKVIKGTSKKNQGPKVHGPKVQGPKVQGPRRKVQGR